LTITDSVDFSSIETMRRHNLNSTDAILLTLLMEFSREPASPQCVVITSDQRLLRAAKPKASPPSTPKPSPPQTSPPSSPLQPDAYQLFSRNHPSAIIAVTVDTGI
jgi:hypothetical protein